MTLNLRLAALMPVNYKRCTTAEQPCTIEGLPYLSAACALTADAKSGITPIWANMVLDMM